MRIRSRRPEARRERPTDPACEHPPTAWQSPHGGTSCCVLPTSPQSYGYVLFILLVIIIVVGIRYGVSIPVPPVTMMIGGAGYAITFRIPRFRLVGARLA